MKLKKMKLLNNIKNWKNYVINIKIYWRNLKMRI